MYDLVIIGGGPAGIAAGVYASRKQLKTLFLTDTFGGQSIVSNEIENWVGDVTIGGMELATKFQKHLEAYAGNIVDIKKGEKVDLIKRNEGNFKIKTFANEYEAKAVLIATGSNRRKLQAKGADKYEHKGLTYCASCDGPLFKDKEVVVIGGGNSALETVLQLLAYTKKVYLIHRRDEFRGDPVTIEAMKKNPKLEIIYDAEVVEVFGEMMVNGLKYKNLKTQEEKELTVNGIFVEIGAIPATNFVEGLVDLNEAGAIKIDPWTQQTSVEGIWAAGDVTNIKYHQNNIAAGDAIRALEDIFLWIKKQ